jgi:hypothetical protein
VPVNFVSPLVVTAGANSALDLEIDLNHPAFIVAHDPPAAQGATLWAVNFHGPVHHHPIAAISSLVLRHHYGSVQSLAADGSSLTFYKDYATLPVVNPEAAVVSTQTLTVLADAENGTLVYDVDGGTSATVMNFSTASALLASGEFLRVAARYQSDGSLVATRIWASSSFNKVWLSPEGHLLHVDAAQNQITVLDESGLPVPVNIDANTAFFYREALNPGQIGTGTGFLANLVRGFKVHVSAVDPLATPMVAQSVDIETAGYSGRISLASATGFTYTHVFGHVADDYQLALAEIANDTLNPSLPGSLSGFAYWNFAYPTLLTSGANAGTQFASAVGGDSATGYSFAGANVFAYGASAATWADPANSQGWSLLWTVLEPTPVPLMVVATPLASNAFTVTTAGGNTPGTVNLSTSSGSATLVYQIDRNQGVVTVSPVDITTSTGLNTLTTALVAGTPVKLYGVPSTSGSLTTYVLFYFTGDLMPAQ